MKLTNIFIIIKMINSGILSRGYFDIIKLKKLRVKMCLKRNTVAFCKKKHSYKK